MNSIKRVLIVGAVLAAVGFGVAAVVLRSELKAQTAVVDKQVIQLSNYELEVKGLTANIQYLNNQAAELNEQAELVAGLNAGHEQQKKFFADEQQDWQINSNQLQVSPNEYTRTWASTALPPDALQLLHHASRSANSYRDKDSDGTTTSKLSTIGLRTAAL